MGAVPQPASFDTIPRVTPTLIARLVSIPKIPPPAARKLNADERMSPKIPLRSGAFTMMIYSDIPIYAALMSGTSFEVINEIRSSPPDATKSVTTPRTMPTVTGDMPNARSTERASVFACRVQPMEREAATQSTAKAAAKKGDSLPPREDM